MGRLAAGDSDAAYNPRKILHQMDATCPFFEVNHLVPSLPCILSSDKGMQVAYTIVSFGWSRRKLLQCNIPQKGVLKGCKNVLWEWRAGQ